MARPRKGTLLDPETGAKRCSGCLAFRRRPDFAPSPNTRDRLASRCRQCCAAYRLGQTAKRREARRPPEPTCPECPAGSATLPLYRKGFVVAYTVVDISDLPSLSSRRWYLAPRESRAYTTLNKPSAPMRTVMLHALLCGEPKWPLSVDHINCDTLDNRRSNLRVCHINDNKLNRGRLSNNRSGFKGVYNCRGRWRAQIRAAGRKYTLGYYDTAEAANDAYALAARRLHGAYARAE